MAKPARQLLTIERLETRWLLSGGSLLSSFGTGGVLEMPYMAASEDSTTSVALTSDGGHVLVGGWSLGSSVRGSLLRYDLDGNLDTSFGNGTGGVRLDTVAWGGVDAIAPMADGSILAAGTVGANTPQVRRITSIGAIDANWTVAAVGTGTKARAILPLDQGRSMFITGREMVRLNANGTPDTTFSTTGRIGFPNETRGGRSTRFAPYSATLQTDGSMVFAGEVVDSANASISTPALRRHNAAGVLDTSFGTGGTMLLPWATPTQSVDNTLTSVAVQSDGKIVATGTNGTSPVVVRLLANGQLDPSFGSGGIWTPAGLTGYADSLVLLPDGQVLATLRTGSALPTATSVPSFVRLLDNGSPDPTYGGGDGIVDHLMPNGWLSGGTLDALRLPDGRVLVASSAYANANAIREQTLTRYAAVDGSLDVSLHADPSPQLAGVVRHSFITPLSIASGLSTMQADGKLIVTGGISSTSYGKLLVARVTADGQPDASFGGGDGLAELDVNGRWQFGADVAVDSAGRMVIVGRRTRFDATRTTSSDDLLVVRLNPDGSPDTTFGAGGGGFTATDLGGTIERLDRVTLLSDGKSLAAGTFQPVGGVSLPVVVRYMPNGQLDAGFGNGGVQVVDVPGVTSETFGDFLAIPDGSVVVAGTARSPVASPSDYDQDRYVVRLDSAGAFDPTFGGGDGVVILDTSASIDHVEMLVGIERDTLTGQLYVGQEPDSLHFSVTRLQPNGALDTSFALNGSDAASPVLRPAVMTAYFRQADGRFVLGGYKTAAGTFDRDMQVARMNSDARGFDSFGSGGTSTITSSSNSDTLVDVEPTRFGRLIAAGTRTVNNGPAKWVFAALQGDEVESNPGGPYTVETGGTLQLNGTGSLAAGGTPVFEWDLDYPAGSTFNVNRTGATQSVTAATFGTPGTTKTIGLLVRGSSGSPSVIVTTQVTVVDHPPAWLATGSAATWVAATNTLTVTGAATFTMDPGAVNPPIVNLSGASASLVIAPGSSTPVHLAALNLADGASAALAPGAGSGTLVVGTLTIAGGAKLDLTNHAMIVRGSSLATVRNAIRSGFNGGTWNGLGVTSSTAAADPNGVTALGYASNSALKRTSFAGVTGLTSTDLLVKYTYAGDADLSGVTNLDDFMLFLLGYQGGGSNWLHGDFDYNGPVTLDDFRLFVAGLQLQREPTNFASSLAASSTPGARSSLKAADSMAESGDDDRANLPIFESDGQQILTRGRIEPAAVTLPTEGEIVAGAAATNVLSSFAHSNDIRSADTILYTDWNGPRFLCGGQLFSHRERSR